MLARWRVSFFSLAFLVASGVCAMSQTLIGTFNINYRYNAAGNSPNGGLNDGNPFYNIQPYGPGPYFVNADPGNYRVVVSGYGAVGPSVADIWSGDANGGIHLHTPRPGNIGDSMDFTHTSGKISFYYWDWYAGDNDTNISTQVQLFRLPASVAVSGIIALQGTLNAVQFIDFTFRPTTGSVFMRTATLNSAGAYSLSAIPLGNYTVSIKGAKWLRKNITVNASTGNVTNANATLLAGDANNDNFADIADLLLLINAYNKVSPNAGYSDAADFNCDGVNDISDLFVLAANYNKQGDS